MELWRRKMRFVTSRRKSSSRQSIWIKKVAQSRNASLRMKFFTTTCFLTVTPTSKEYSSSVIWRINCCAHSLKSTNRMIATLIWTNASILPAHFWITSSGIISTNSSRTCQSRWFVKSIRARGVLLKTIWASSMIRICIKSSNRRRLRTGWSVRYLLVISVLRVSRVTRSV